MKRRLFTSLVVLSLFSAMVVPISASAAPARGGSTQTPLGIDISWPQCGKKLPSDPAFVVVGVNGGLATTTNQCLASQLSYAHAKATGKITSQPKVQLYVNTANPGGMGLPSWPSNNVDPAGNLAPNPYLTACDNSDSLACAWQYGWNRAVEDVINRFQPAAVIARVDNVPGNYIWWLDVETENTWKMGGTAFDYTSNVAVLEGMAAYFKSRDFKYGLYSTGSQWNQIVGNAVSSTSNLNGLPNWRPGGANLTTAKDACQAAPLTVNGQVVLTQFISRGLDYNYSCI